MRVNTNISALQANNQMARNVGAQGRSMEKLSSGLRIKRAADDAAGMAISEKMRAKMRGLEQADRNVQDGISVVQTAEGALEETTNIVQRMRELSVQGASETNSSNERKKIAEELTQLKEEVGRISKNTEFNGQQLLNANDNSIAIQVGAGTTTEDRISINLVNTSTLLDTATVDAGTLGLDGKAGSDAFKGVIDKLDVALETVNTSRSKLGSQQNRLESTSNNLNNSIENVKSAESRIRDVDVAKEMMNLSKMNILVQASQSMLAQANQQPQAALQLLQ